MFIYRLSIYDSVLWGRIEEGNKTERAQMMKHCFIICALDSRRVADASRVLGIYSIYDYI